MPRTNLPLTTLAPNSAIDIAAGTPIDQLNGMNIALAAKVVPAAPTSANMILYVASTAVTDKTVTVRQGVGGGAVPGAAFRSGIGDLVAVAHTASGGCIIGPLETARFLQLDSSVSIDFQAGITGTIVAYIMPSRW